MTVTAYIALGSNLGDRRAYLDQALQALRTRPGVVVGKVSSYHETAPVGGPAGQGAYLNAAAELHTDLEPRALLKVLLEIEQQFGRVRTERYGPRTLDLDLLLYGDFVSREADLTVPHPRMHERPFVLNPLVEIAPEAVHPVLGRTVQDLAATVSANPGPSAAIANRELRGQRAVVTGSSSGIGRAIALELARAGADMVIHRRGPLAGAEAVAEEARTLGVLARAVQADLSQPDECCRLVETVWTEGRGIHIWVNNAGADTLTGAAARWSFERKLQELLAVDVTATVLLSRDVGQRMKQAGHGVILNLGWDQAETGMEGDSGQLFAAAKGAVMAFNKSLALALAPEVRVNCLAPGWIRTAWGEQASSAWQERVRRETPLRRWGLPEDVAAAARWLVSPAAAYLTGQTIRINGGAIR
jgi:2-amino-4-hydroxy-6-hydroxymethyldihydropteridine diphosphokinase